MNYLIFDTETTSLQKPFCYNVGYTIINNDGDILEKREYVIEQCWNNLPLFSSAYYADKREIYVGKMRGKTALLRKWGYVTQQMIRDIKNFDVVCAYAYNSSFDEKVFNFNCDWYKTINPFDTIPVYDIMGLVSEKIMFSPAFHDFCEKYEYFTDTGNYSTTAETVYRYITHNVEFVESHTALDDAEIETDILMYCVRCGCEFGIEYELIRPKRKIKKTLKIVNKKENYNVEYEYYTKRQVKDTIYLS